MATNFVREGDTLEVEAPSGGLTAGHVYSIGNAFGVVLTNTASGANAILKTGGVWDIAKTNAASMSMAVGANVHWDNSGKAATTSATSNVKIGVCLAVVSNTDTTVRVRLNPSM